MLIALDCRFVFCPFLAKLIIFFPESPSSIFFHGADCFLNTFNRYRLGPKWILVCPSSTLIIHQCYILCKVIEFRFLSVISKPVIPPFFILQTYPSSCGRLLSELSRGWSIGYLLYNKHINERSMVNVQGISNQRFWAHRSQRRNFMRVFQQSLCSF